MGTTVPLAAAASDDDGRVLAVSFYAGPSLIGTDTNAPFSGSWVPSVTGVYSLVAVAQDDGGLAATSSPVTVTVQPGGIPSAGTTNTWVNPLGGAFENGENWSNGVPPGALDTAIFDLSAGPYEVAWGGSVTNLAVTVKKGSPVWNLQGAGYYFQASNNFSLVQGGGVELVISNGLFAITDTGKDRYLYLSSGGSTNLARVDVRGAVVKSSRVFIGNAPGDRVRLRVDGPESRWVEPFGGYCNWGVGANGRTEVVVTNGACIRLGGNLNFGCSAGHHAVVVVSGAGSSFTNGGIAMPYGVYTPPATATVVVADGAWVYGTGGTSVRSNGTIRLEGGQFLNSSTNLALDVARGGVVEGSGLIRAKVRNAGGLIRPGGEGAVGTLTVTGEVVNADAGTMTTNGTIRIELAGVEAYDRLVVQGRLVASGNLEVRLAGGYVPRHGERFRILDCRSVSGAFAAVDLPGGPARWNLGLLYQTGEIVYRSTGAFILLR